MTSQKIAIGLVAVGSTRTLQMILGHDHLSTTEIYLNMQPQQVLEEFQRKW